LVYFFKGKDCIPQYVIFYWIVAYQPFANMALEY
jgi:hypothetical protein